MKMYKQLMKDIKTHPEDVIDSLKAKQKKDIVTGISLSTAVALGTTADEIEQAR